MPSIHLTCPIDDPSRLTELSAGTPVLLSGTVLTGRDAAHQRLHDLIAAREPLPIDLTNHILYYVRPGPAAPGQVVGAAGPTTSSRMDPYTPELLEFGLKGTIGKGYRSQAVKEAFVQHQAVYFGAIGGLGALLSRTIVGQRILAFPELGPEAMYEFAVKDFPAIVLMDCAGRDFYQEGQSTFRHMS
ncbi:FumA C-terminus/TtdB family hydratase beta subunit [Sulfobacillus harzensis]|uniref:TRZ/ATZ family protein n=1 Tax=Sulfobacillus harzensis TaxID=2729629 RepID=A0A7Y0L6C7_9FIRM|nr:FumA C-terminus/TtdB family hydratase beta subunit [Sulfobacillus harzensis]NMP24102.1 TRZ/ATZ family protein [Sulfobacillus harzensis]